jgi:hypothetical protein
MGIVLRAKQVRAQVRACILRLNWRAMALDAFAMGPDGRHWKTGARLLPLDDGIRAVWRAAHRECAGLGAEDDAEAGTGEEHPEDDHEGAGYERGEYMECGILHGSACWVLSEVLGEPVMHAGSMSWIYWTAEFVQRLHGRADWDRAHALAQNQQFLLDNWYAQPEFDGDSDHVIGFRLDTDAFWADVHKSRVFLETCARHNFWIMLTA